MIEFDITFVAGTEHHYENGSKPIMGMRPDIGSELSIDVITKGKDVCEDVVSGLSGTFSFPETIKTSREAAEHVINKFNRNSDDGKIVIWSCDKNGNTLGKVLYDYKTVRTP